MTTIIPARYTTSPAGDVTPSLCLMSLFCSRYKCLASNLKANPDFALNFALG